MKVQREFSLKEMKILKMTMTIYTHKAKQKEAANGLSPHPHENNLMFSTTEYVKLRIQSHDLDVNRTVFNEFYRQVDVQSCHGLGGLLGQLEHCVYSLHKPGHTSKKILYFPH
jgi:hypothetical protein